MIEDFERSFGLLMRCLRIISSPHSQLYTEKTATTIKNCTVLHQIIVKFQIKYYKIQVSELAEPKERLFHTFHAKFVLKSGKVLAIMPKYSLIHGLLKYKEERRKLVVLLNFLLHEAPILASSVLGSIELGAVMRDL